MKNVSVKLIVALAFALFFNTLSAQDFGDHSSSTLTSKAWAELGKGNHDMAITYVDKCIELYMAEAKKMQSGLKDFAPEGDNEKIASFWALNDVGTCLFIKGQALLKKGNKDAAKKVYKMLTDSLKYAQCWDNNGWYWKPAEAAKQALVELDLD